MPKEEEFKAGDIVSLNSGGPLMTVQSTFYDKSGLKWTQCNWFVKGNTYSWGDLKTSKFQFKELRKFNEDE